MTVSDNAFRFLSIRPPQFEARNENIVRGPENLIESVSKAVEKKTSDNEDDRGNGRIKVAKLLFRRATYFKNSKSKWRGLSEKLWPLIHEAIKSEDVKTIKVAQQKFLEEFSEKKAKTIVTFDAIGKTRTFKSFHDSLWISYFATVLDSRGRANDQQQLIDWVRFLSALEVTANSPDEELVEKVKRARRLRLEIPYMWFKPTEETKKKAANALKEINNNLILKGEKFSKTVAKLKESRKKLKNSKTIVVRAFNRQNLELFEKQKKIEENRIDIVHRQEVLLAQLRKSAKVVDEDLQKLMATIVENQGPLKKGTEGNNDDAAKLQGKQKNEKNSRSTDQIVINPNEQLTKSPGYFLGKPSKKLTTAVERSGLSIELDDIPSIIQALDEKIALATADLFRLHRSAKMNGRN